LQAWHVPAQALSQQTPSAQAPVEQSAPVRQATPSPERQDPFPSQAFPSASQVPESCTPAGTGWHSPSCPESAQLWQAPVHAVAQQTPSTQMPLTQSPEAEQPLPVSFLQPPAPLQTLGAAQLSSSVWPAAT
jgi:hypothetical protein